MNSNLYAVIMAGGIGSRFWPISTSAFPKQFHDMLGTGQSLLQKTHSRLQNFVSKDHIWVLTNQRYSELVLKQIQGMTKNQIVPEPAMRNTAPCILLAALKIYKENPQGIMLVAPSDHWIEDETAFKNDINSAVERCEKNNLLITLGIKPTFPNTGYGYIESESQNTSEFQRVTQFREKPDYQTAKSFLAEGNFLWNAGIFVWSAKSIIQAFETHLPAMHSLFLAGMGSLNTSEENRFLETNYAQAENISIDFGVMEKADNVYVKKATFDWNDLGTWGALHEKLNKDEYGNAIVNAVPVMKDSEGNMIFTTSEKLVVIDGIKDYIVVDKANVLLIYPKEKEQKIKSLLTEISHTFGKTYE